jgi:hypothetical protein
MVGTRPAEHKTAVARRAPPYSTCASITAAWTTRDGPETSVSKSGPPEDRLDELLERLPGGAPLDAEEVEAILAEMIPDKPLTPEQRRRRMHLAQLVAERAAYRKD